MAFSVFFYRWFGGWHEAITALRADRELRGRLEERLERRGSLWTSPGDHPEIVEHVRKLGSYLSDALVSEAQKDSVRLLFQEWQRGIQDDRNAHYNAVQALRAPN